MHMGHKPKYFSFLDPFSLTLWLFMLLIYLAARLSHYEWYNPHLCLQVCPHILENQYMLGNSLCLPGNSLCLPVSSFMQQGLEIMPRALPFHCISGV